METELPAATAVKFSERIRLKIIKFREANGLSRADFVEGLDVGREAIYQIEKGNCKPSLDLLDRIELKYGIKF